MSIITSVWPAFGRTLGRCYERAQGIASRWPGLASVRRVTPSPRPAKPRPTGRLHAARDAGARVASAARSGAAQAVRWVEVACGWPANGRWPSAVPVSQLVPATQAARTELGAQGGAQGSVHGAGGWMQVELPAQLLSTEANVLAVPLVAPSQAGPGPWFDQVGPEFVPVPEPPALATLAVALVVLLLLRLLHGRPS